MTSLGKVARSATLATGQIIMSRKGFSAAGPTEILTHAGVPKGSFYHDFASKDAFGEAMLAAYFNDHHAEMDELFARPGLTMAERLMIYLANWRQAQGAPECQGRCLAVKLGGEVADLSEPMRFALKSGTRGIIARLSGAIDAGLAEGSLQVAEPAGEVAAVLYHQWSGASVMVKILRDQKPLETANRSTRRVLGIVVH